jgi:hypothetical protein
VKSPDFASLDPPAVPGETIAWCPICGEVVNRRPKEIPPFTDLEEANAALHMLLAHDMTPDVAVAALMEAVRQ